MPVSPSTFPPLPLSVVSRPDVPCLLRCLRAWIALLSLALVAGAALARTVTPVVIGEGGSRQDPWFAVGLWSDPDGRTDIGTVLSQLDDFTPPVGPHANLGVRKDVVWVHVPVLSLGQRRAHWLLDIDYPALDWIDMYLIRDGTVVQHLRTGDHLRFSERPLATRSLALPLDIDEPGRYEVLLRVQTTSTMALPMSLVREDLYHADEAAHEASQGLLTGIGLCLLAYSLAQWASLRDPGFLFYGLNVLGVGLFFLNQFGLAAQHLWGEHPWLLDRLSPLSVLMALTGGMMFIDHILVVRALYPRISRMLRLCAAVALVTGVLFALDLVSYRVAGLVSTALGPVPMVLAMPVAWTRARRGDRAALFLFIGWGVYAIGVAVMAALLRGQAPVNFWTQHALQFSSMGEMAMWMMVLGVRTEEVRRQVDEAHRDRDRLAWLAHTDPLTGALNRRGLHSGLQPLLQSASSRHLHAIFLIDLDGFKPVNDLHGHEVGDALLVEVVRRLRHTLRGPDLVARIGGDEFVVVTPGLTSTDQAETVGRKLMQVFATPFDVLSQSCRVGATIGYALAPVDGADTDTLLRLADAALYAGKQAGRRQLRRGGLDVLVGSPSA